MKTRLNWTLKAKDTINIQQTKEVNMQEDGGEKSEEQNADRKGSQRIVHKQNIPKSMPGTFTVIGRNITFFRRVLVIFDDVTRESSSSSPRWMPNRNGEVRHFVRCHTH